MRRIQDERPEKLRGGYYTSAPVADLLTAWATEHRPRTVLEPSCGDGEFLRSIARVGAPSVRRVVAVELDAGEAGKARRAARRVRGAEVVHADFLDWALDALAAGASFDAVVGNPPYVRYQYLDDRCQQKIETLYQRLELPFTRHTNAWVPFVVASLRMLRPGGRFAMLLPAELLHVLHAQVARDALVEACARVVALDPGSVFEGTLQGVLLVLAEKRTGDGEAAVVLGRVAELEGALREPGIAGGALLGKKWTGGWLQPDERALLDRLAGERRVVRFGDVASVDVGIVTGANGFFLVPDDVVDAYDLHRFATPMFGRSEHVRGAIYDEAVHLENRRRGLPTNFLHFGDLARSKLPAGAKRYIAHGESLALHRRFKCRIREPWWAVPSVRAAPVGLLKRSHDVPRMVLNRLGAYTTDTAYRVIPLTWSATELVYNFTSSLTALSAELEGRSYGGGVLELVPSEIERLLLPRPRRRPSRLADLDALLRAGAPAPAVLDAQDRVVLGAIGLAAPDRELLRGAWLRLRNRRQRAPQSGRVGESIAAR